MASRVFRSKKFQYNFHNQEFGASKLMGFIDKVFVFVSISVKNLNLSINDTKSYFIFSTKSEN